MPCVTYEVFSGVIVCWNVSLELHKRNVGVLNAANELLELVSEVLAPLFRHHEVVLEHDRQALPDHVTCKGAFGLGQRARRRLVGHAARHALVKGPHVPFELCIWVGQILVGQDFGGERAVGGVSDESVNTISELLVGPLECVGQMPSPVPCVAL